MTSVTFITGNQAKADFFAEHMDFPVKHRKVDLDEIQSLDLQAITEHKARQAYAIVGSPVLVEDVGLVFESLNTLPGPFIKWFQSALGLEGLCELVDGLPSRKAVDMVCFAYYDGRELKFFNGEVHGEIAKKPRGSGGFGFDPIFIPDGSEKTFAEMPSEELEKKSLRTSTVYPQLKEFLDSLS